MYFSFVENVCLSMPQAVGEQPGQDALERGHGVCIYYQYRDSLPMQMTFELKVKQVVEYFLQM